MYLCRFLSGCYFSRRYVLSECTISDWFAVLSHRGRQRLTNILFENSVWAQAGTVRRKTIPFSEFLRNNKL